MYTIPLKQAAWDVCLKALVRMVISQLGSSWDWLIDHEGFVYANATPIGAAGLDFVLRALGRVNPGIPVHPWTPGVKAQTHWRQSSTHADRTWASCLASVHCGKLGSPQSLQTMKQVASGGRQRSFSRHLEKRETSHWTKPINQLADKWSFRLAK